MDVNQHMIGFIASKSTNYRLYWEEMHFQEIFARRAEWKLYSQAPICCCCGCCDCWGRRQLGKPASPEKTNCSVDKNLAVNVKTKQVNEWASPNENDANGRSHRSSARKKSYPSLFRHQGCLLVSSETAKVVTAGSQGLKRESRPTSTLAPNHLMKK